MQCNWSFHSYIQNLSKVYCNVIMVHMAKHLKVKGWVVDSIWNSLNKVGKHFHNSLFFNFSVLLTDKKIREAITYLWVVLSSNCPPLRASAEGLKLSRIWRGCCLYTLLYSVRVHGWSPLFMTFVGRWGHLCRLSTE